jgi:hypothetical protein
VAKAREYFVENFLQPLAAGGRQPSFRYDEDRALNVMSDGRALVDVELEGGTVTFTKAEGERDDSDRDREPTTVTMVEAEGFDHTALTALRAGTITLTEANAEATDADEDEDISQLRCRPTAGPAEGSLGLLGTMTGTRVDAEQTDVD